MPVTSQTPAAQTTTNNRTQQSITAELPTHLTFGRKQLFALEGASVANTEQILNIENTRNSENLTNNQMSNDKKNQSASANNSTYESSKLTVVDSSAKTDVMANAGETTTSVENTNSGNNNSVESVNSNSGVEQLFKIADVGEIVKGLDKIRTEEFEKYLGKEPKEEGQQVERNTVQNQDMRQLGVSLSSVQDILKQVAVTPGKRSAIIYIVSRPQQLELILLGPEGAPIRQSVPAANQESLYLTIAQFRTAITSPLKRGNKSYLPSSQQLYQWIIAPLENDLNKMGIDTILFSMDEQLRSLPVAALHDGNKFLVEKYSTSLIPSFRLTDLSYESLKNGRVLAMGASVFKELTPLPSVPLELKAISQQWQGQFFLNENFTEENLRAQRQKTPFEIVHLASHAEFVPGSPSNSFIALWNEKLQLSEIPSLNWNEPKVELLVLSACQTALGDREAELGFGGLAVQAGAKSAMASLWYVDDSATLGLMAEFYRQLQSSSTKSDALREAQLALLRGQVSFEDGKLRVKDQDFVLPPALQGLESKDLIHPFYWSGFTLIGSPW